MKYGYTKQLDISFVEAIEKTKKQLDLEGFGIMTEIDVKATLKKKLDVDFDNYLILGVCNPESAYQVLQVEREIGLFLPCNVIVYERDGKVYVSAMLPSAAMGMIGNPELEEVGMLVEEKLKKVIDEV